MKKPIKKGNSTTLESFIDYYMDGNMQRFLRKHKKQYLFQLTYSVTLKHVKNSNPKMYKYIMSKNLYPQDLRGILNIFITLDKHFDIGFNKRAFDEILIVEEELREIIRAYMFKLRSNWAKLDRGRFEKERITKKEAIKEQKARGFVHINDFEDYHPQYAHLISIADDSLYYPKNIPTTTTQMREEHTLDGYPYIMNSLIAVEGWTRIRIPK